MDIKQACLDLSNSAIALFDIVEEGGDDAALEGMDNILLLTTIVRLSDELREYYFRRNVQRMLALGVSPEALIRMAGVNDGS